MSAVGAHQLAPAAATAACRIHLVTGELVVRVREARRPLDALCGFAARHNPRRGFLVVSKLLGRHMPARPAAMREAARDLAALLPADLPGPVLVVGLAETAVCLGQLLAREWRRLIGRRDLAFIHSTRVQLAQPVLCRFEEPHSHAAAHLIYQPAIPMFVPPRSLVLVDDEISTGTTLGNLAQALVACWPGVETITAATLTDWADGAWLARTPRPARTVSLLSGELEWRPSGAPTAPHAHPPIGALGVLPKHRNRGRLGWIGDDIDIPPLPPGLPDGPLRVIGTGEFSYPPFLLAERLEREGRDVVVQATSRSPAWIGGAIGHALVFRDNYETGVPNYLYNAAPANGRESLICHETPAGSIDPALIAALDADTLAWPA